MSKVKIYLQGLVAGLAVAACASAAAIETYGNVNVPPGVYFGAGNPNGNFNVSTGNGLELALRAKNRSGPPLINGASGVYDVAKGFCQGACGSPKATWNYEFSIHTTDSADDLANYIFRLGVDHDAGAGTNFSYVNPVTYWGDNAMDGNDGRQNSQNVYFAGTPGGPFDIFQPGLYDFVLLAYASTDTGFTNALNAVDITVHVVPEPASMALAGAGLLALAAARRRRAQRV